MLFLCDIGVDPAKAIVRASPIVFGPCTLGRTWGTRPIPWKLAMTQTVARLISVGTTISLRAL
jgi:hypothetical protein